MTENRRQYWPENGTDLVDIFEQNYSILIDYELFSTNAFSSVYDRWTKRGSYGKKTIFVRCKERHNIRLKYTESIECIDLKQLAIDLKRIGKNWVYLTKYSNNSERIRESCRDEGIYIRLYRLDNNGHVQGIYNKSYSEKSKENKTRLYIPKEAFELPTEITSFYPIVFKSNQIPATGDTVYNSKNTPIELRGEFLSNPQSITYQTNTENYQAKIYTKEWLSVSYYRDKVKKMLNHPIKMDGICWPVDLLFNNQKEFVGILVPKAEGYQLKQDVMSQVGLEKNFQGWDKRSLVHVTKNILQKVGYLQDRNVILGLINTSAIFVKDVDHVYLTEMDTMQIEGFPILSYEKVMQPPELQDSKQELRLYTKQQDNYEIALLTFMLLMPGKFPYNKGKNKSVSDSVKNMNFAFHYGGNRYSEHGAHEYFGLWRFVWSHLGNDLKKSFYETFQKGQLYSKPEDRRDAKFWFGKVRNLEEELKSPYDVESLKLFPRTFKRYSGTETITCKKCGIAHPKFYYKYPEKRICNSCIGKPSDMHFVCKSCQMEYYYDYSTLFKYEKLVVTKGFEMPTHCPYCRSDKDKCKSCGAMVPTYRLNSEGLCPDCAKKKKEMIVRKYNCSDCGREIKLTQGEVDFYYNKGWSIPSRCSKCRDKRKKY